MKKLITTVILVMPLAVNAQNIYQLPGGVTMSREVSDTIAIILTFYLTIMFILTIIKSILDYRLKSQMIDKGVSDKIVEQFLQPTNRDAKGHAMKWFLILAGIGVGLAIISYTLPLGIHSLSVMAFSLALSFLGYYIFIRQSDKRQP